VRRGWARVGNRGSLALLSWGTRFRRILIKLALKEDAERARRPTCAFPSGCAIRFAILSAIVSPKDCSTARAPLCVFLSQALVCNYFRKVVKQ
jgi:hypothetical protein